MVLPVIVARAEVGGLMGSCVRTVEREGGEVGLWSALRERKGRALQHEAPVISLVLTSGIHCVNQPMLLSFLLEEAARSINDRGRVLESLEGCMIIWDGLGVEKHSASCQARAYPIPSVGLTNQIDCELTSLLNNI